jgi:hypothetical protein
LQAKLAQLELDKKDSGQDEENIKQEILEKQKIFNDEELPIWQRLCNKISNQNDDIIIKNGKVMRYNRPKKNCMDQ